MSLIQIGDDVLSTSIATWNSGGGESIRIDDPQSSVLAAFEYVPKALELGGKPTKWKVLTCSDNGKEVGQPFKDSYGLLNMAGFRSVIEDLIAGLEKAGVKWYIATTGTLRSRGRIFLSIGIEGADKLNVEGREFQAFLNCLNSVDKSCTVTFSNNTFCVCCKNTFAAALHCKDDSPFHAKIKHSKGMKAALSDVPKLLEAYLTGNEKILKTLKRFAEIRVTTTEAEQLYAAFVGGAVEVDAKGQRLVTMPAVLTSRSANIVAALGGLFQRGKGNNGETMLDLFSGMTEYYTHKSAGESEDPSKQIESSEIGSAAKSKARFFELLSWAIEKKERYTGWAKVGDKLMIAYRDEKVRRANAKDAIAE